MLTISNEEVYDGMRVENPWWDGKRRPLGIENYPQRAYLVGFRHLILQRDVRRSVILLGPRRVGKTVMILQAIDGLLRQGVKGDHVVYLSVDRPLYGQKRLEQLLSLHLEQLGETSSAPMWVFFDEVQYVPNWEQELKSLTDLYPNIRFVASGSAAAALRRQSQESGAGRFTDYLLPALTFDEFIAFQTDDDPALARLRGFVSSNAEDTGMLKPQDIQYLNVLFEQYLTYGGYPEAVLNAQVQEGMGRFVREDIVDKILLRDLPSLYGISDTRELNRLFSTLCYNSAQEVSLEKLSQTGAVAKNTLKRYMDYLEAAFLIRTCARVDNNARAFQRQSAFKVYLTNPSLRAALFRPVLQDDEAFGHLAETGVLSQWFHNPDLSELHYARWAAGEVDIVHIDPATQTPSWFVEVKWTDRFVDRFHELSAVREFCRRHEASLRSGVVTTRTRFGRERVGGVEIKLVPTAIHAWMVGRQVLEKSENSQLSLFEW